MRHRYRQTKISLSLWESRAVAKCDTHGEGAGAIATYLRSRLCVLKTLQFVLFFLLCFTPSLAYAQYGLGQERISESQWSRGFHGLNMIAAGNELEHIALEEFRDSRPEDVLVVVIGQLKGLPLNITNHVNNGGAALVASDSSRPYSNVSFAGFRFGRIYGPYQTNDEESFEGMQDCPVIRNFSDHPIVDGVNEIITNRPGFITSGRRETVAWLPTSFRYRRRARSFIAANEFRNGGRVVAVGDQSVFTNQMIFFGDNATFANQTLKWLKNEKRKKLLILMDGSEHSALDPSDVLVDVPPPTQQEVLDALEDLPPSAILEFANSVATVVEDENMVNEFIHDSVDNIPEWALRRFYVFLMFGIACFALVVAYVCQGKLQSQTASEVAWKKSQGEQTDVKTIQFRERQRAAHFLLDRFCVDIAGRHFNDWPSFPTEIVMEDDQESKSIFESMTKMGILYKSKPTDFWTRRKLSKLENEVSRWRHYFESRPSIQNATTAKSYI